MQNVKKSFADSLFFLGILSGLFSSACITGCSTSSGHRDNPRDNRRENSIFSEQKNSEDSHAFEVKSNSDKDQDLRDQLLVSKALKKQSGTTQAVSSVAKDPSLPETLYSHMPEGQLFAEIVDRYQAQDSVAFALATRVYLSKYNRPDHVDEVILMRGFLEFKNSNYGLALLQFNQVLRSHPQGDKAAEALFAKGLVYKKMNLPRESKQVLSQVVDQYPESPEARRAAKEAKIIK